MSPDCAIFIVMGKTDPAADKHRQQSMILVPRDTPGVTVHRGMRVFGYTDALARRPRRDHLHRRPGAGREPDRR